MVLAVTAAAGVFSLLTYIAPYLLTVTGVPSGGLPWMLVILGVGNAVGAFAGGRLGDWDPVRSFVGLMGVFAAVFAATFVTGTGQIAMAATLVLFGAVGFAGLTPLQLIIINAARETPNLASMLLQSAFNIGIAVGSFVSSAALTLGFSYRQLPWIGFALISTVATIAYFALIPRRDTAAEGDRTT
jgi:DHA1 family inner membrane transport protein